MPQIPRTFTVEKRKDAIDTMQFYESYYRCHIKDDPLTALKMSEVEEEATKNGWNQNF